MRSGVFFVSLSAPALALLACTSFGTDAPYPPADAAASETAPPGDAAAGDGASDGGAETCALDAAFGKGIPVGGLSAYSVEAVRFGAIRSTVYLSLCPADGSKPGCEMYQGTSTTVSDTFGGFNAMSTVNKPNVYDSYPTVTGDAQWLLFGSSRGGGSGVKVYQAHAEAGVFAAPKDLGLGFALSNEPYLLGDGHTFYFAASASADTPQWDLYRATGTVPSFPSPTSVTAVNLSDSHEFAPVPSEDELEIFFASSRAPGSESNLDIWRATRASVSDPFGTPVRMDALSGGQNDFPTSISPDHCELYYIQKSGAGAGAGVAYVARRPRAR
ncbi:MAG TPA: hypothetical protein VLT33_46145 [Labilithrix sp.]|nr:hypothetical protein [Labilithrix sp.]